MNDDGIACLTDFGISSMARGYTSLKYTTVQSFQGTLRWMTPELLCVVAPSSDGSNVDESNVDEDPTVASDWYALAVTMWEVCKSISTDVQQIANSDCSSADLLW